MKKGLMMAGCILVVLIFVLSIKTPVAVEEKQGVINSGGSTLKERIMPPEGFERIEAKEGTFGDFLRNLPLKPDGTKVLYYNGGIKRNEVYAAVVDMEIGDKDLQQCADAVIRLRAEYLYKNRLFQKIRFNFTSGFTAEYSRWAEGYRIMVRDNQASWVKKTGYSDGYTTFRAYLDTVFTYAGTLSLSGELKPVKIEQMEIGDVFIRGGSPGHCVIVVDMAANKTTGEKLFLLAQSYMPAQDIHILKNPENKALSPWYSLNFGDLLLTPEWVFENDELKRFID